MTAVSLIVAGPTAPAEEVEQTLRCWVEAGLLRPVLWLNRDQVDGGRPQELTARRLQHDRFEDVALLEELATLDIDVVRLVSVHLAVEQETDAGLSRDVEAVARFLFDFIAATQALERLNLVVPTTGRVAMDPRIVGDPGVKHVLVSPEDRVNDRRTSREVVWPGAGYAGHAALAISTIAGLWWATETAPFDGRTVTGSGERSQVVVTRSFARVLRAAELSDRIAVEVFERRRAEAWTAAAVQAVNAPNPVRVTEDLADQLGRVEGAAVTHRPAPRTTGPVQQSVGILQAFGMMFLFILRKLREAPSQMAGNLAAGVRRAVEGFAQNMTFGADSSVTVGSGGSAGYEGSNHPQRAADSAARLLRDMGRSTSPPATAALWDALRGVAFGMVDAGAFPGAVRPPEDGARRLVVNEVDHVVSPPETSFRIDPAALGAPHPLPAWALEPVLPWDVGRLRALRDLLVEGQSLAANGRASQTGVDDRVIEGVEPDPELAARLEAVIASLDEYMSRHGGSLLSTFGGRLSDSLGRAGHSFVNALRTVRVGELDDEGNKMRLAARWLYRWWGLILLVVLALPAVGWYGVREGWWEADLRQLLAVAAVIWVVGWFVSFASYQRKVFRIQYEIGRRHRDYLDAILRAEHDALETVRLASLYDQFLDWAAIIAWMVHHPEGRLTLEAHDSLPPPRQPPLAMQVAEGIPSEETLQRTSAIVGRSVFSRGWLGNLYRSYARTSMAELKHQLGLPREAPDPDPDRDLAKPSPRSHIREQVSSGALAGEWHERVRSQVDAALADLPPDELFRDLQALVGADTIEGDATAFLRDLLPERGRATPLLQSVWRAESLFSRPNEVERVTLWVPRQLAGPAEQGVAVNCSALADEAIAGAFVLAVVRCDASKGTPADDLEVFRRPANATAGIEDTGGPAKRSHIG